MCVSNVERKTGSLILDNPIINVDSSRPALLKVGGSGKSAFSFGTKGKSVLKFGGEGDALFGFGNKGRSGALGYGSEGFHYLGAERLFKGRGGGGGIGSPPNITEPPPSRGRNQELAVKTARADLKRRLALLGFKRFLLTSGRGDTSVPTLGKKALLGR